MRWADIPKTAVRWMKVTERSQEVLVISEPAFWFSHWDPRKSRSVRCGGRACYPCSIGVQKQLRVVVLVVDPAGKECLLELRERHREKLDKYEKMVGVRLRVWKAGAAKNSPVEVKVSGEQYAHERDITRLVDLLGEAPILLGSLEQSHPEELQPDPLREVEARFE